MLCPFCGKERRDHKRCPKCHKAQRQKWRGATESDYIHLFRPQEETEAILYDDVSTENNLGIDMGTTESFRTTIFRVATNWMKRVKINMYRKDE